MQSRLFAGPVGWVDATNKKGWTPLHVAAHAGREKVGKLLIDDGASVNAKIGDGRTPLHHLVGKSYNTDFARLLINGGADVDATTKRGWTPLHYAASSGSKQNVELLLAAGADINVRSTSRNVTPLDEAIRCKHSTIIELLREKGAKEGDEIEAGKSE